LFYEEISAILAINRILSFLGECFTVFKILNSKPFIVVGVWKTGSSNHIKLVILVMGQ
jgi:hypothetical protein